MKGRSVRTAATCGALLLTLTIAGGPVAQAGSAGRHCAYRLDPVAYPDAHTVSAELVLVGCYDTFAEALAAGSGGAIQVSRSTSPGQLTDAMVSESIQPAAVDDTLIGTEWNSVGYNGGSSSYWAPDSCAGTVYSVSYVGDAWNDDFESGKGFGGCDTNKKFQHSNFGGDVLTCTPNCNDYGALRNLVSSLKWRP